MSSAGSFARKVVGRWEALLVLLILLVGYWCTTLSPFFLTRLNLLDLVTPYIFLGLLAFGLTFVVVSGEIDISVCSVMAVSAVSFAEIWQRGTNVWIAARWGLSSRLYWASSTACSSACSTCRRSPSRSERSPRTVVSPS